MWRAELTAGASAVAWPAAGSRACAEQGRSESWEPGLLRTLAGLLPSPPEPRPTPPTSALARCDRRAHQLRAHAAEMDCFGFHPELLLSAAHQTTFDGELARLERAGEEGPWRVAKDTWASHGVPHHAAYAGWRLAEVLLADGRRKDAEAELASAYLAAETHVPLRRKIEGLAQRADWPSQSLTRPGPPRSRSRLTTPPTASPPVSSTSCASSGPAPPTERSGDGCT